MKSTHVINGVSAVAVRSILLVLSLLMLSVGARAANDPGAGVVTPPDPATALKTLRPGHPRLLLAPEELEGLKALIAKDPIVQAYYEQVVNEGEAMLSQPPVERVLIGPRLLDKSRRVVDRIHTLGLLYRLQGDRKWSDRAVKELMAVSGFADWNPSHFLDVAEMTYGFAIGYDWLYPVMTAEQRATVKKAIVEKGLLPARKAHETKAWWTHSEFNWNNVCNGGIVAGALAVADEEPELCGYLVSQCVAKLPLALASYAPDGAWAEGPGYWGYATRYTIVAIDSLRHALGTDFGLSRMPGMDQAGLFRIYMAGPTGLFFNFADAGEKSGREPSLFRLAQWYQKPVLAMAARRAVSQNASALDLLYYEGDGMPEDLRLLPLDRHFKGADVVLMRSSWLEGAALFAGFKAGDNKANHSNLDLGCFVMDALGERWAIELGGDEYNLPGYFGNKRWTYYRMRTEGQNCLLLNDENQSPKAAASILAFKSLPDSTFAVADLTAGYAPQGARRVQRGLGLLDQRRRMIVQDEFEAAEPVKAVWAMHTRASIQTDGMRAVLTQKGKTLEARILAPADAVFASAEVNLDPPQKSTAGIRKLLVVLPEKTRQTRITVLLSPGKTSEKDYKGAVRPLADWPTKGIEP